MNQLFINISWLLIIKVDLFQNNKLLTDFIQLKHYSDLRNWYNSVSGNSCEELCFGYSGGDTKNRADGGENIGNSVGQVNVLVGTFSSASGTT